MRTPTSFAGFDHTFSALGTEIFACLVSVRPEQSEVLAQKTFEELEQKYIGWQKLFNRFDPSSCLSECNKHLRVARSVPAEMLDVARRCLKWHRETGGLFDPRILSYLKAFGYAQDFFTTDFSNVEPSLIGAVPQVPLEQDLVIDGDKLVFRVPMDFSGIAKGWITDHAAEWLHSQGWEHFLVDSGGDMFASGHDESGNAWPLGVEGVEESVLQLHLCDEAVATSGISRRHWQAGGKEFHHIINPQSPQEFSFDLRSVTVVSSEVETSDVLAKTLFLMGKEKGMIWAEEHALKAVFVGSDGRVSVSADLFSSGTANGLAVSR